MAQNQMTATPKPAKPPRMPKPAKGGGGGGNYAKIQHLLAGSNLSPAQVSALMAYIAGGGKNGPGMGPIATQAQNEIDPLIAAITGQANAQAGAADKAIQGLTNSYAKQIAGINYGQPYSSGEAQQAAVDAALRGDLSGQGNQLGAQLSQSLQALQGSSGAGAVNQEAQALASQGQNAGNAQAASGSANLSNLIADAAASNEYGKKMPGVVRLAGLQGVDQAQGQAQQAIEQGVTQAESELPTIEQDIKANRATIAANKAENAYRNQSLRLATQKALVSERQGAARLGIEQQNANTSVDRLQFEAQNASQKDKQAWARIGIENKRLQLSMQNAQSKLHSGGFTPSELQHLDVTAAQIARGAFNGVPATSNTPRLPKLGFKAAMTEMAKEGIPTSVALRELKLAGFKPGMRGTPPTTLQKTLLNLTFGGGVHTTQQAQTIVKLAHDYMGTPYQWGGESPKGFDCSGFAQYLYGKVGISIPRTTYTQWRAGSAVAKGKLLPGDLVFFKGSDSVGGLPGHVGIYIGNGLMIDAPHTGSDVRIDNVENFGGYMGARRYGRG